MIGPGKYDKECTAAREATKAQGVLLMIFAGDRGNGFACQASPAIAATLPRILRDIAEQIEQSGGKA